MVVLEAPYPALAAQVTLPAAEWGDEIRNLATVIVHEMADGSVRTVVRDTNKREREMTFILSEWKKDELAQFIDLYAADQWTVDGTPYYFLGTFEADARSRSATTKQTESHTVSLRFREV